MLSSESILFNGLREIFAGKKSRPLIPHESPSGTGAMGLGMQKPEIAHGTSLKLFLFFRNEL
jgi:hypothetical protein